MQPICEEGEFSDYFPIIAKDSLPKRKSFGAAVGKKSLEVPRGENCVGNLSEIELWEMKA